MIKLNPFAISELLTAIVYLPLFLLIFIKGKTKLAKIYSFHMLAVFIWGIGGFLVSVSTKPHLAEELWKITYVGVLFIPVFFYHAVLILTERRAPLILFLIYLQAILFSILALNGEIIVLTRYVYNSFYWVKGSPFFVYSIIPWVTISVSTHLALIAYYQKYYPNQKGQIRALILIMIAFAGGFTNFFPGLDIDIYPVGNFFVPLVSVVITYAIFKHQLFDITIVIKKSVVYSVLIAFISLLYLLTVFLLERFAQGLLGYRSLIISIFTAFGLGLLFFPLRHRIQQFVDRYFFKGTQEEIAQQNVQLRQEIALSEKYKTLSTLASGIAHEIKNPLTAMKTFCEYLPRRLDDREFLLKFSRLVGKEVERIDGLVHELLDYSKPGPLTLKRTDINKLAEDTLSTLSNQFIKHHIEVAQHLSPDNYHLIIDANRVKQVLLNLFLNAIEAMPSGGKLTVSSFVDRTSHIVTIADTGSGIAPEDLKHIFDPFFSRKDHGTGLGLAIVQGIMEQHRGKVRITSQVGVGTEVKLEFPITA